MILLAERTIEEVDDKAKGGLARISYWNGSMSIMRTTHVCAGEDDVRSPSNTIDEHRRCAVVSSPLEVATGKYSLIITITSGSEHQHCLSGLTATWKHLQKFQVQCAETEMAVPRVRASNGRISGPCESVSDQQTFSNRRQSYINPRDHVDRCCSTVSIEANLGVSGEDKSPPKINIYWKPTSVSD
jgi:hypothetical protein